MNSKDDVLNCSSNGFAEGFIFSDISMHAKKRHNSDTYSAQQIDHALTSLYYTGDLLANENFSRFSLVKLGSGYQSLP
jgi:hypothetical protein